MTSKKESDLKNELSIKNDKFMKEIEKKANSTLAQKEAQSMEQLNKKFEKEQQELKKNLDQ